MNEKTRDFLKIDAADQLASNAATWRDRDGHAHKTERSEKAAAEAEKANQERKPDFSLMAMRMPPD